MMRFRLILVVVLSMSAILSVGWFVAVNAGSAPPEARSGKVSSFAAEEESVASRVTPLERELAFSSIAVRVVDEEKNPVAGARIQKIRIGKEVGRAESAANGRVVVDAKEEVDYWIIVHPTHAPLEVRYSEVISSREVTLRGDAYLELEIVDTQDMPVTGAAITVNQVSSLGRSVSFVTDSDMSGKAILRGMSYGEYRLTVSADGLIPISYDVDGMLPAAGRVRMLRPLIALGECQGSLDSYKARMSRAAIEAHLTPSGVSQMGVQKIVSELREGRPRLIAMAIAATELEVPEGACLQVSYVSNGAWGYVELPFRRLGGGPPVSFGSADTPASGELVKLTIRDPSGLVVPMKNLRLVFTPQDAEELAHPIYVTSDEFQIRLPPGRYQLESKTAAVQAALPETWIDVEEGAALDAKKLIEVTLEHHVMAVSLSLPDRVNRISGDILDAGSVGVISDDGPQEVRHFPDHGLSKATFMMLEGWSSIRVFDSNNHETHIRSEVRRSGEGVVGENGKIQ